MLLGTNTRHSYVAPQLVETICQLRFPTILTINTRPPAEFQDMVRGDFPRYHTQEETPPAKNKNEKPRPITNHFFVSADGTWKVNLTESFVALSTVRYTTWEEFAGRLDRVLEQFISIYRPSFFERIGLRYINAFSRKSLNLEGTPWRDLINAPFIGALEEELLDETRTSRTTVDVETKFEDDIGLKLHTGPGMLNRGKEQDPEPKFILDGDFSVAGNLQMIRIPESLTLLHSYAVRLFNAAQTRELSEAMGREIL